MTPQEITDLAGSVRGRSAELVRRRFDDEETAIKAEAARVQALCAEHTGHVFKPYVGLFPLSFTKKFQECVYCGAREVVEDKGADHG